ncbi:aldehyde dehydrogenase [Gordonia sp. TBRC 11910]|uniref:Aldehyde dehydrogenase n=2 Tax=Gordonia asplenii TaxID=2725283 RepID=A0A848KSG9_9ACTN|nr:aldehyde dehydrogenase [Gordonia asplenii]
MFIGGEWVDTDDHYDVINPATEEVNVTCAKATPAHVDAAVAAGKAAFESGEWRNTPPAERAALFDRVGQRVMARAEEFTVEGTKGTGMPLRLSGALGVGFPVGHVFHYAELIRKHEWVRPAPIGGAALQTGYIAKEPLGVTAGICPWNFPANFAMWKTLPSMAVGNSVVIKVDEKTPTFALELAAIFKEEGLPDGVLNVIVGDGPVVGEALVQHPDVALISFTGSTAVGRHVMEASAKHLKRVLLELGGKGPNIVLEDADLDIAVDGSIWAFCMHAGQACESGTRLLLPASIHDEFVERLVARMKTLKVGNPLDPATDIGPVMSAQQRERILGYIESGKAQGATVALGGDSPQGPGYEKGFWVNPTVFTNASNDMKISCEEIFGPVVSVIKYDTVDEAIQIANDTEYGLSAGIWTTDATKGLEIAQQLKAGSVWINDWHNINNDLPFGGYKQSGFGRELGPDALDEFTQDKAITIDLTNDLNKKFYGLVLSTPLGQE